MTRHFLKKIKIIGKNMKKIKNYELFLTTTDTVIGLGGKVNEIIFKKIYEIKKRDKSKKLVIVIANIKQLKKFEILSNKHLNYIKQYWPGNTTLIINNNAYRMPNHKGLLKLIKKEGPFYLTSANISNNSTIISMEMAKKVFPGVKSFYFGHGSNKESQIIDTKTGERLR